ncbi:MAG TPA: SRPBCC domain-containing protein [Solirubrobacteraceae bacterium]|nr:SRPBCC domain-containing protein [Solirubrobacteraceae bacterium]
MTEQIERQLDLPAPPAEVWPYLLEPARLQEWLADEVALELAPGGEASFRVGDERRSGWVQEIVSPADGASEARLVFWWNADGEPASRVTVTLTETAEHHTRVRIVETRPLEILDLVGLPLPGQWDSSPGPSLVAAGV